MLQESLEAIHKREASCSNLTNEFDLAQELRAKKQRDRDRSRSTFFASASAGFGDTYQYTNNSSNFVISMGLPD
jgi:hypothetical protein